MHYTEILIVGMCLSEKRGRSKEIIIFIQEGSNKYFLLANKLKHRDVMEAIRQFSGTLFQ